MTSNPGVTAGDYIIGAWSYPTDAVTGHTGQAISQAGITFGTITEVGEVRTTTGRDMGGYLLRGAVSSGTATGAPTISATAARTVTNARGPGVFIRAREVAAPGIPTFYDEDAGVSQVAFKGISTNQTTPVVRASASHSSTFNRFELEFNTQSDFNGSAYTETFSGTYSSNTPYNLQTTGSLGLPSTNGVTYYIRARASADAGSHYGPWSTANIRSYTYNSTNPNEWFQTTDEQFNEWTTASDVRRTDSGSVQIADTPYIRGWTSGAREIASTTITLDKPSTTRSGDLLIIIVGNDDTSNTAQWDNATFKPTGFTLISESGNATTDAHVAAFYRIADGSESDTITVTAQSADDYWGYYLRVVGADAVSTINALGTALNIGTGLTGTIPGLVTTVNNTLVFYAHAYDGGDGNPFGASGTGWSKIDGINATGGNSTDAAAAGGSFGSAFQSSAGLISGVTISAGVSDGHTGFQFAVAPSNATSGTIMSPEIDFDWVHNALSWDKASFTTTETVGDVKVQVYYTSSSSCDTIVPNTHLAGNSSGFDVSSGDIDLTGLVDVSGVYNKICLKATLTNVGGTPTLDSWKVTWVPARVFSGIVYDGDYVTPVSKSLTLKASINGGVQSYSGSVTAGTGVFSILTAIPNVGDVITVWIDSDGGDQASLVLKYGSSCDSYPDCGSLNLFLGNLVIANNDTGSITTTDLANCDQDSGLGCSDSDIGFIADSSLQLSAGVSTLYIANHTSFVPGTDVSAGKIYVVGTYVGSVSQSLELTSSGTSTTCSSSSAQPLCVVGSFTAPSNVYYKGTSDTLVTSTSYTNLFIEPQAGGATYTLGSGSLATSGDLNIGDGVNAVTVNANTNDPTIVTAGTLHILNNAALQASNSASLSIGGDWNNEGTFTHSNGSVIFTATDTGNSLITNNDSFSDVTFNGSGGSWSASDDLVVEADLTVTNGTISLGTKNLDLGSTAVSDSGNLRVSSGGSLTQNSSATTTIISSDGGTNCLGGSGASCSSSMGTISLGNLTIGNGTEETNSSFNSSSGTLTITGVMTVASSSIFDLLAGTINFTANGTPLVANGSFNTSPSTANTVSFTPAGTSGVTIPSLTYYNLTVNKASNTFTPSAGTLTLNNNLTISAGTLNLNTNDPDVEVTGSLINSGTLTASNTGTLTLHDDFTNNGTFTHSSGLVVADPTTNDTTIVFSGSSNINFYDFTNTTNNSRLEFTSGNTYGFAGALTLTANPGKSIWVSSTTPGSQWFIDYTGSSATFNRINVKDSGCVGNDLDQHPTVFDQGNNGSCWRFIVRGSGGNLNSPVDGGGSGGTGGEGGGGEGGGTGGEGGGSGGTGGEGGGGAGGGGGGSSP
ncbi:MAG: hypothetical protein R3B41_00730 [Candidatus Doudnabacteria bacterium]